MSANVRLRSNLAGAMQTARIAVAKRLLAGAVLLQTEHKKRLSVGNPSPHDTPSLPGEYPRARTGFGRSQADVDPKDPAKIAADLEVFVGLRQPGWYLAYLTAERDRKGLEDTAADLKERIGAAITGGGSA